MRGKRVTWSSFLALVGEIAAHVDVEPVQSRGQTKDGANDRHLLPPTARLKHDSCSTIGRLETTYVLSANHMKA